MELTDVFKIISNPIRFEILQWLKNPKQHFDVADQLVDADIEGVCVTIIQKKTGLSQSTVSAYLSSLQRVNLLSSKRIGGWTYYKRNEDEVSQFIGKLKDNM